MLRSLAICNFIHFRDFTTLQFNNGPNLFIGCNGTGKSSVLELVRSSLDETLNSSDSSTYTKKRNAYAFSLYDLIDDDKLEFEKASQLISAVIKTVKEEIKGIKLLMLNLASPRKDVEVHAIIYNMNGPEENKTFKLTKEDVNIFEILHQPTEKTMETAIEKILDVLKAAPQQNNSKTNTEINEYLKNLRKHVVTTFPMRSIGPMQWSRSNKLKPSEDDNDQNYKDASERAEILQELLDNREVHQETDKEIFHFLTFPDIYEFIREKDSKKIKVKNSSSQSEFFQLLKCPEGVFEARQFSLIMSYTGFRTICFDEPDKGMHPQMIERMQLYLRTVEQKKVVIIISHNPSFINSMNSKSTFVFYREHPEQPNEQARNQQTISESTSADTVREKMVHRVQSIEDISSKLTDSDDVKKILFASKILLVEGKTDKKVIEAMFEEILRKSDFKLNGKILKPTEKYEIVGHQIISQGGCDAKFISPLVKDICAHSCTLFDQDKIVRQKENRIVKIISKDLRSMDEDLTKLWKDKTVQDFIESKDGFKTLSQKLQTKDIFIWKYGDLEDTIIRAMMHERFQRIFNEKNFKTAIKDELKIIKEKELSRLAEHLLEEEEIGRFITFLLEH